MMTSAVLFTARLIPDAPTLTLVAWDAKDGFKAGSYA